MLSFSCPPWASVHSAWMNLPNLLPRFFLFVLLLLYLPRPPPPPFQIIQNYYCDPSPLQVKLYEDFMKSKTMQSLKSDKNEERVKKSAFVMLNYLRKICDSPLLILTDKHPATPAILKKLEERGSSLHDLAHSPKLCSLRELLCECGIGVEGTRTCCTTGQHNNNFCCVALCWC